MQIRFLATLAIAVCACSDAAEAGVESDHVEQMSETAIGSHVMPVVSSESLPGKEPRRRLLRIREAEDDKSTSLSPTDEERMARLVNKISQGFSNNPAALTYLVSQVGKGATSEKSVAAIVKPKAAAILEDVLESTSALKKSKPKKAKAAHATENKLGVTTRAMKRKSMAK